MGNDGGSIPKRRELVIEAARKPTTAELKEKQAEHQQHHWSSDPLTQAPLAAPVVSDALGRLYNKDSIIEYLLPSPDTAPARRAEHEAFVNGAVKRLKDVVELRFEVDPAGEAEGARVNGGARTEKWICPITHKELGAWTKAVYVVPCGHVFSEAALRNTASGTGERKCLQCDEAYAPSDVIPILPSSDEDKLRLTQRSKDLKERGLTHSLKKDKAEGSKKRKKEAAATVEGAAAAGKAKEQAGAIKDAATASLTAKVLAEQEERNKRRKLAGNDNLNSLFTKKRDGTSAGKNVDFMTRGYAIPR